jgi:hypothetical protein
VYLLAGLLDQQGVERNQVCAALTNTLAHVAYTTCCMTAVVLCLRLQDYWTNRELNEVKFVPRLKTANATNVLINGTKTLWVSLDS